MTDAELYAENIDRRFHGAFFRRCELLGTDRAIEEFEQWMMVVADRR